MKEREQGTVRTRMETEKVKDGWVYGICIGGVMVHGESLEVARKIGVC